jgi:putative transposase
VATAYRTSAQSVHRLTYHVVFCPKYRRPVLTAPVAAAFRELLDGVARDHGWTVVEAAVQDDHVRLVLRVGPTDCPAAVVRAIKGRTSPHRRRLFPRKFGRSRLPGLWARSNFVATTGRVSPATVQRLPPDEQLLRPAHGLPRDVLPGGRAGVR